MKIESRNISIKIFGNFKQTAFLFSVMHQAYKVGVFGITRYTMDGAVYIEAEGENGKLELFKEWCMNIAEKYEKEKTEISYKKLKGYEEFNIID